jgi:RNA polymerase sigma factor (sigma-70 family)
MVAGALLASHALEFLRAVNLYGGAHMSTKESGPPHDMLAILPDDQVPAPTVTASSLAKTVRATMPSKTRKYDTSQAAEELYRTHAESLRQGEADLYEKVTFEIYAIYRPRIVKIARKYRSLSPIFGEEDLQQEALIAILQALRKYRHSPDIRMKFSTYLEWSIRNIFQRAIGSRDKYVEIYGSDGAFEKTMGYGRFVEQKKALEGAGCTYTTKKRFCYLSEVLREDDLEAKLDQASLAPHEYSTQSETSEEPPEIRETEETSEREDEQGDEPETTAYYRLDSAGGIDQEMNSLYRQWARSPGRSDVTDNDPVVLRIYDLCRERAEELFLPFRHNNGASIDADEVRKYILSAIVRGLAIHDDDAVPHVPFFLSLTVAMKRSVETLRKKQLASEQGGAPCVPEK